MSQLTTLLKNRTKPLRVLIIEDSPYDADLVTEELKRGGFDPIYERVESEEAMRTALISNDWDIILSDYSMPLFSGPDALEVLKESHLDIPFIMISGTVGEEVAVTSLKAGAHDFLVKGQLTRLVPAILRELEEAQRRQAARVLERKFLITFEQVAVGIAHVGASGEWLLLNQKYCQILGYSHEELIGHTFQEITYPDDLAVDLMQFQQLKAGEIESYSLEKRHTKKQGALIWVNLTVSGVFDDCRQFEYALVVMEDITHRKSMEQALKNSEERYRLILAGGNDGIWDYNLSTQNAFWNDRFYEIIGYRPEELEKQGLEFLFSRIHPEDLPLVRTAWEKSLREHTPYQGECRFQQAVGHYIHLFIKGKPVLDEQGQVYRVAGVIVNITNLKQTQQALEEYTQRLELSNKELEQFATIASHDLQEPLRKIMIFSEMLAPTVSVAGKDYFQRLQSAVTRMQTLITDLLSLSRINRKGQAFHAIDLNEAPTMVLDDLQISLEETKGQVVIEPLGRVDGDESQIHQLLQNLIGNALKYHREHIPPVIKIYGHLTEDGHSYRTTIEDNGIGIKEEYYERIFEPFQRLHGVGVYPGTGMGLSICKKIVERHNGSFSINSQPGQGSQFSFTLPISKS